MDKELINRLYEEDQEIRDGIDNLTEDVIKVNKKHIELILPYIGKWKSIPKEIGYSTLFEIFILILHADWNLPLQEWFLSLVEKSIKGDKKAHLRSSYPLLYDKVNLAKGKPQRFGTQISIVDYNVVLHDIEDMDNVDSLRSEYGLEPLQDYIDKFK